VRLTVSLGAACAMLACSQPPSVPRTMPPAEPAVIVARDSNGVTATAHYPGRCVASLSHSSPGALRYRNECEPVLSANVRMLAALMAALFGTAALPDEVTQLDAGRLVMTWPDLALRLALAARASPDWDAKRAARDDGHANALVRDLANRQGVFREIEDLFGRRGRGVALASVQKVLIGPPGLTPIAAQLRASGVGEREPLPFDAQLWFQLPPAAVTMRFNSSSVSTRVTEASVGA